MPQPQLAVRVALSICHPLDTSRGSCYVLRTRGVSRNQQHRQYGRKARPAGPPGVGETFGKDGDVSRRSKEPAMAITNPRFAPTVMASLVDLLLDRQACIGHSVAALRNEVADAFTRRDLSDMLDSQDPAADSDGAGVLLLLQQAEQRLWEVEQALQRLDSGTYGYCTTCGRGIRLQRLRALPTATSCFTCCAESPPERSEGQ
jgi:DnaK suppressor protein